MEYLAASEMIFRLWHLLIFWTCLMNTRVYSTDQVSADISNYFEPNSSYSERQWNISWGADIIRDEPMDKHIEDCLEKMSPKHSLWWSKGPLCDICSKVERQKFPSNDSIRLRYGAFMHGILTFSESEDELLIDVIACSYDVNEGIDRFYITRGIKESSAYFLQNVGSKNHMYTFILNDYLTYDDNSTCTQSIGNAHNDFNDRNQKM